MRIEPLSSMITQMQNGYESAGRVLRAPPIESPSMMNKEQMEALLDLSVYGQNAAAMKLIRMVGQLFDAQA